MVISCLICFCIVSLCLQKVDVPNTIETTVIGYEYIDDNMVQLTTEEEGLRTYNVRDDVLRKGLELDDDEDLGDTLASKIPFECTFVQNGQENLFSLGIGE